MSKRSSIFRALCATLRPIWRRYLRHRSAFVNFLEMRRAALWQKRVDAQINKLKALTRPIRVAFFVNNDAVFQLERVFQLMCEDPAFDPFIVIITGVKRSEGFDADQWQVHQRTFSSLRKKYGARVYDSWNGSSVVDFSSKCDLCTSMHSYEGYVHKYCRMSYMTRKGVPAFFVDYSGPLGVIWEDHYFRSSLFSYLWRFYASADFIYELLKGRQDNLLRMGRVVVSGYPKFDLLSDVPKRNRSRKKVILAPHHTIVTSEEFQISNFLRYADFLLKLPARYPEIDWVFRPHPVLLPKMVAVGYWTEGDKDRYLNTMRSFSNVEVQLGGDYYNTFVNSDALIQDCGSFLSEYHVTGHPQCFVIKEPGFEKTQFLECGLKMLNHVYKAYSEEGIIDFIENVVIKGEDPMREDRMAFVRSSLMMNYPHISEFILNDIKKALGRD